MDNPTSKRVFLSYSQENRDFVESIARRLRGDARLSFWFGPWHSIPGLPIQDQMEEALDQSDSCAVFIGGGSDRITGWQNEQMRVALRKRIKDSRTGIAMARKYRVIPVFVPGEGRPETDDLPAFLLNYIKPDELPVEFTAPDDEVAFKRLLAGILGIPPIQVEGYLEAERAGARLPAPPPGAFKQGQALIIGVANYPEVPPLPRSVLDDARDLCALLTEPARCGYPTAQVTLLLEKEASGSAIRAALADLALRAGPDDTAIFYFSGHGARQPNGDQERQYILPYDCDPDDLPGTAIAGDEMTAMLRRNRAGRLLVLFDSCHSAGAGDPKGLRPGGEGELREKALLLPKSSPAGLPGRVKRGLSEDYYQLLAQGKGRAVIAACRSDEFSWVLRGWRNSLFTHYLLEALRGEARTLGDGYVRVFDLFRHVAAEVPTRADQHPVFKASAMEEDFAIAFARG